jgi:hypothetical protein
MAADIRSTNRSRTPWLIVGGHRPMYVSSNNEMAPDGEAGPACLPSVVLHGVWLAACAGAAALGWRLLAA